MMVVRRAVVEQGGYQSVRADDERGALGEAVRPALAPAAVPRRRRRRGAAARGIAAHRCLRRLRSLDHACLASDGQVAWVNHTTLLCPALRLELTLGAFAPSDAWQPLLLVSTSCCLRAVGCQVCVFLCGTSLA